MEQRGVRHHDHSLSLFYGLLPREVTVLSNIHQGMVKILISFSILFLQRERQKSAQKDSRQLQFLELYYSCFCKY